MKKKIDAVIVVEGKTDVDFLSNFLDADFVTTNGSALSKETIRYLKTISTQRDIIVLTDPDYPGLQIRARIQEQIPQVYHAYVRKEQSIRKHKVGVAESNQEEVLRALEGIEIQRKRQNTSLTMQDLMDLGCVGEDQSFSLRKKIEKDFCLGSVRSGKQLLKQLQMLGIEKKDLISWKEKQNDCK